MRYFYKKPSVYLTMYGKPYKCDHPVYNRCTLYLIGNRGLCVIQQRFDEVKKRTWWDEIDPWLNDDLYLNPNFKDYFEKNSRECKDGLYPTVSIRQIMNALKMKPLKKERWETVFDRKDI